MEWLIAAAIVWILCAVIGAAITSSRGHSSGLGFVLGLLFGPLGVLIAAVLAIQPATGKPERMNGHQVRTVAQILMSQGAQRVVVVREGMITPLVILDPSLNRGILLTEKATRQSLRL